MGKLTFTVYLCVLTLFSSLAFAQEVNLLKNPNFESRTSQWLRTGSGTFNIESAAPLEGTYSAKWNPSATGEFFRSSTYTIPAGMQGAKCAISMRYLWDSGTLGHILMNVDDGTNNIATVTISPTVGGVSEVAATSFDCPSSGTVRFELESTADAAEITTDSKFIGTGKNNLQISQAEILGTLNYAGTANCDWSVASGGPSGFAADTDCPAPTVTGTLTAPGTKIPGFVVASLPAGKYEVIFQGAMYGGGSACNYRLHDGTNALLGTAYVTSAANQNVNTLVGYVEYSAPQTNITFQMQVTVAIDAGSCNIYNQQTSNSVSFILKKQPTSSAGAMTFDTISQIWSGYHDTNCSWGTTSASYVLPGGDATCTFTQRTNTNFGTITSLTDGTGPQAGIIVPITRLGTYTVCANVVNSASATATRELRLWDGTTVIDTDTAAEGDIGIRDTSSLCGPYKATSIGNKTFSVQIQTTAGTATINASTGATIEWSIKSETQSLPAPVFTELQNLSKSSTEIQEEWVAFSGATEAASCTSSPCTILRQSGRVSTVTRGGTGDYVVNFSPAFAALPVCTCIAFSPASSANNCTTNAAPTTSTFNIVTHDLGTPTARDSVVYVHCKAVR